MLSINFKPLEAIQPPDLKNVHCFLKVGSIKSHFERRPRKESFARARMPDRNTSMKKKTAVLEEGKHGGKEKKESEEGKGSCAVRVRLLK